MYICYICTYAIYMCRIYKCGEYICDEHTFANCYVVHTYGAAYIRTEWKTRSCFMPTYLLPPRNGRRNLGFLFMEAINRQSIGNQCNWCWQYQQGVIIGKICVWLHFYTHWYPQALFTAEQACRRGKKQRWDLFLACPCFVLRFWKHWIDAERNSI